MGEWVAARHYAEISEVWRRALVAALGSRCKRHLCSLSALCYMLARPCNGQSVPPNCDLNFLPTAASHAVAVSVAFTVPNRPARYQ
jgi:hypothetical protein